MCQCVCAVAKSGNRCRTRAQAHDISGRWCRTATRSRRRRTTWVLIVAFWHTQWGEKSLENSRQWRPHSNRNVMKWLQSTGRVLYVFFWRKKPRRSLFNSRTKVTVRQIVATKKLEVSFFGRQFVNSCAASAIDSRDIDKNEPVATFHSLSEKNFGHPNTSLKKMHCSSLVRISHVTVLLPTI